MVVMDLWPKLNVDEMTQYVLQGYVFIFQFCYIKEQFDKLTLFFFLCSLILQHREQ